MSRSIKTELQRQLEEEKQKALRLQKLQETLEQAALDDGSGSEEEDEDKDEGSDASGGTEDDGSGSESDDEASSDDQSDDLPERLQVTHQENFVKAIEKRGGKALKVVVPFEAISSKEMTVYLGEVVELLDDNRYVGKWRVVTADGEKGYVPETHLEPLAEAKTLKPNPNQQQPEQPNSDRNRMSPDIQKKFKARLEQEQKRICVATTNVPANDNADFDIDAGEFLELLYDLQNSELCRIKNVNGKAGNISKRNVIKLNNNPYLNSGERSLTPSVVSSPTNSTSKEPTKDTTSVSQKPPEASGRRQNDYTDKRKIGAGTFGTAYLVIRKRDNKEIVIKSVELDGVNDSKIKKEAEFLYQHQHKYIVRYLGSFIENGKLYIETEFCSRGNLRKAINEKKDAGEIFSEDDIRKWTFQLSLALQHLHKLEIIHRDVKAENVFVTESYDVKLGDLGSASQLETFSGKQANTLIGTFPYLAPEIARVEPYGKKVDLWSLGVLVHFLAALDYPFGENMVNVLKSLAMKTPAPRLPDNRSKELCRFVDHLLVYDPNERPDISDVFQERFLRRYTPN